MARLKSIDIAGWKSIRKTETPIELGPLNVLIGANGAGKSNLFSFLIMLRELVNQRLQNYVGRSAGADTLLHYGSKRTESILAKYLFELSEFEVEHKFELIHAAPDSLLITDDHWKYAEGVRSNENTTTPALNELREFAPTLEAGLLRPIYKEICHFFDTFRIYHIDDTSTSAKIRLTNSLDDDLELYRDGSNLAVILYVYRNAYPKLYARIIRTIQSVFPSFDGFVSETERLNSRKTLLRWRQKGSDYTLGPHQISDGTLRAMAIITILMQSEEDLPSVLLLDEPELGLHPHAIEIIASLIRSASHKTQIIVATQSPALLDHFDPEEIIVVDSLDGESKFSRLSSDELKDWLSRYSIGELWEKNVVGGGPLQ